MNPRFIIFLITIAICVNIYYDNVFISNFNKYKKYYKIGLVLISGLGLSVMSKHNPSRSLDTFSSFNNLVNGMQVNHNASDHFLPYLPQTKSQRVQNNKTGKTKRSVSETKKKYVASSQNWRCKHCQQQLSAWFEVDHIKELEHGGSNDVTNLQALCRECHAKKGSMRKLI